MFAALIPLISAAAGLFGAKKSKDAAKKASHGATLQDVLPQLMALMQQQQTQQSQNYQMQQRKALLTDPGAASIFGGQAPAGAVPLQEALARMAYGLLPTSARGGQMGPQAAPGGMAPMAGQVPPLPMPPMGQAKPRGMI